ncbi:MAG: hypothetical protein IJ071_08085 [Ruminococcus sp.]|nr:hypothetical protein [Ruminococcus sp.]
MTAATSTKNKSYFGRRFATRLAESKKLLIVNFVFSLLGLPLLSLVFVLMEYYDKKNVSIYEVFQPDAYLAIGAVAVFASFAMGLIIALFHFRYLYQKQLVDMNYSLPLSSGQRFFADYLSGLFIYLLPIAVGTVISYGIVLIGEASFGGSAITDMLGHITVSGIIVVVGLIMLYTFAVLGIVFCGSTFEAIFSIVALNVMIPATIACLWIAMIYSSAFGIDESSIIKSLFFTATSPFGAGVFFGDYLSNGEFIVMGNYGAPMATWNYFSWLITAAAVIFIALLAAFLLYKKRKAEDVSKPYVFKSYYYAIITMAVFCILSLFISDGDNIIAGIIICAVGWFLMEVITRRGFKKFWTAGVGFALAVGSVFVICAVCKATDGFGASRKVPSASSISSVEIGSYSYASFGSGISVFTTDDPEVIDQVIKLHEEIIDRHFHSENYEYEQFSEDSSENYFVSDCSFNVSYRMKSGSTLSRRYTINTAMMTDLMKAVYLSDDYAKDASERFFMNMANTSDEWFRSYEDAEKYATKGIVGIEDKLMLTGDALNVKKDDMIQLRDAYRRDLEAMTAEELSSGEVFCYVGDNWVLDSFKETKSVLLSMGYSPDDMDEAYLKNVFSNGNYDPSIYIYSDFELCSHISSNMSDTGNFFSYYGDEDWHLDKEKTMSQFGFAYRNDYYGYGYYEDGQSNYNNGVMFINSRTEYDKADVAQLLGHLTSLVFDERPIAVVTINGSIYCLKDTPENSALLEKVVNG